MAQRNSEWNWGIELWAKENADFILHTVTPLVWIILFIGIMDRQSFLETWYMPFLGVFAAFLANSVPLGGGIVYIPVLSLLGANIQLGSAFTLAIMPFGNGIFGFLRWLVKNSEVIRWEVFPYVVLSSWIGSFLAVFVLPTPETAWIKFGFGIFCLVLGTLVTAAVYRGGLRNVFGFPAVPTLIEKRIPLVQTFTVASIPDHPEDDLISIDHTIEASAEAIEENSSEIGTETDSLLADTEIESANIATSTTTHQSISLSDTQKWILIVVGFFGGVVFVPNIGIGPALFTYVTLALFGYGETAAMVTGIVTGGWVCALPLLWNLLLLPQNIPYKLWVMTVPGVFYGAKVCSYRYC